MVQRELSSRFLNIYNELSEYMEKYLNLRDYRSHVQMLNIMSKKNHIIKNYYDELRTFANLRNIIVHDSTSKYNPIAEPNKEAVKLYEKILNKLKDPPDAYQIATKKEEMIFAHKNMRLMDCIIKMHEKNFSYLPVCEDDKLIGVLSGDSIFTYMRENSIITIHENFTVGELKDCIRNHIDERYSFVARETPISEIVEMYSNDIQDGKRLGAVFVTATGGKHEKILGMISAWDLIEYIGKEEQ